MIRYYKRLDGKLTELDSLEPGCWVNILPPFSQEEVEELAQELLIPLDFLTDSLDIDERSRYEREDDVRLIVVNTPVLNENDSENEAIYITVPIGIILTPDCILTITAFQNPVIDLFLDDKVKNFEPGDDSLFVLLLLEQNVYRFLSCLKQLNAKRNAVERELYDSSRSRELRQLLSIEKSLVYFVTSLSSNELLKMKMKRVDLLGIAKDEDKTDLFEAILIDSNQALEMANVYTHILSGTMDAFASIISNNLNIVIQRLTLVTILLAVPTLITSFYGMNVPLPFAQGKYTALFIVLFALSASLSIAWFLRRKKMF